MRSLTNSRQLSYSKAGLEARVDGWRKWNWYTDPLADGGSSYYYYSGGSVNLALPSTTSCWTTAVVWGPTGGGSNADPWTDRPVDTGGNRQTFPGREG